jgi:hypothetical protein
MKAYKIELFVMDFENLGDDEVTRIIESSKYINAEVISFKTAEVEWEDDHPLNSHNTFTEAYNNLFLDKKVEK